MAIVNATFVRNILRGRPATGIRLATSLTKAQPWIVGVVADVTPAGEPDLAAVYVPIDLAIRLALGASPGRALWTVVALCASVTMGGAALGVVGALMTAPWIASLLYGVRPHDAATMSAAPALLAAVGIIAGVRARVSARAAGDAGRQAAKRVG